MKLVVFDCDGTLVDSADEIAANMRATFESLNLTWPGQAATRRCIGLSLPQTMQNLHPQGSTQTHEALVEAYRNLFYNSSEAVRQRPQGGQVFFDGALEALARLRQRDDVLLAIATGKSQRGVTRMLANAEIPRSAFVSVQTADDAPSKPNPAMVLQAMAEAGGIGGHNTVMIGDASYDIEMARAAGAFALGVEWGYHPVDILQRSGAHKIMSHFNQMDDILDGFWEQ